MQKTKSIYQIKVKGHLPDNWSDWFDGFEIENLPTPETLITGEIVDQATLHGILQRIRDLGLTLIEVKKVEQHKKGDSHGNSEHQS